MTNVVWADADHDGWTVEESTEICQGSELPAGYLAESNGSDCNDGEASVWAIVPGWEDADGDGFAIAESLDFCAGDSLPDGWLAEAPEVADCDDSDETVWAYMDGHPDLDGDGYGASVSFPACSGDTLAAGYSDDGTDCNDDDPLKWQYLGGQQDLDLDGFGAGGTVVACSGETLAYGFSDEPAVDCDDFNPAVWAFMAGWLDADGDGYGAGNGVSLCAGSAVTDGYALNGTDCDDDDASAWGLADVHADADGDGFGALDAPGVETCVGDAAPQWTSFVASDCDDAAPQYWMIAAVVADADGDGHGIGAPMDSCVGDSPVPGWALLSAGEDCDDGAAQHWFDCLACVDQDWDGYGEACDMGPDCDDTSTVTRPGAPEIPDDGADNDCAGDGDATRSDAVGVFVDPIAGDDGNAGTMDAPMQTLTAAIPFATASGKSVFVAAGFQATQNLNVTADIHGGYALPDWTRDISVPEYTHLEAVDFFLLTITQSSDVVISGLMLSGQDTSVLSYMIYNLGATTLVHMSILGGDAATVTGVHNAGALWIDGSNVNGGFGDVECVGLYNSPEATARLSDTMMNSGFCNGTGATETGINNVGTLVLSGSWINGGITQGNTYGLKHGADATTVVSGSFIDAATSMVGSSFAVIASGDRMKLVNNVLTGGDTPPGQATWVISLDGPGVESHMLVNNVIRLGNGGLGGGVRLKSGESTLVNNIIVSEGSSSLPAIACIDLDGGLPRVTHLHANDVFVGGPLWSDGTELALGSDDLNECALPCCASASGNVSVDPVFAVESEWELDAGSPCLDAGQDPAPWISFLFADFDGALHPGLSGAFNIGADASN